MKIVGVRTGPCLAIAISLWIGSGRAAELSGDLSGLKPEYQQALTRILDRATVERAAVTSTERTPKRQVELMYKMVVERGVAAAKQLYCRPGDAVIDKYDAAKSQEANLRAMEDELNRRLPEALELGCLNHIQNPFVQAVDVDVASVPEAKRARLIEHGRAAVRAGEIVRFFYPPQDEKAFHFEFKK